MLRGVSLKAQDNIPENFRVWSAFLAEKKITGALEANLNFTNKLNNFVKRRDESYIEPGLYYSWEKISIGGFYRFIDINQGYKPDLYAQRISFFLSYQKNIKKLKISYRTLFQSQYQISGSNEIVEYSESYSRQRFLISYDISKIHLRPYFNYELFLRVNSCKPIRNEKNRFEIGSQYELNPSNKIILRTLFQKAINVEQPYIDYIFALKYVLELF